MSDPSFIHLRVHSEYSLVDGIVRIKPLVARLAEQQVPAVAITDKSNLFALVKFYKAAMSAGIKPITGSDLWVKNPDEPDKPYNLLLLVQNKEGYKNLTRLVSRGYQEGQYLGRPMLQMAWLDQHTCAGIIALSGAKTGDIGVSLLGDREDEAIERLGVWLKLFPNRFYIELQRTGRAKEEDYNHLAVALASSQKVPVVATNDVCFLDMEDFPAHDIRVCIHDGYQLDNPTRPHNYSAQQYLRSPAEMQLLFEDIPEALANSVEIAKRCNIELDLGKNYLPDFPIPDGLTEDEFFIQESEQGLDKRLDTILDKHAEDYAEQRKIYDDRLKFELNVIIEMGFPGYFLIVADFIEWAKSNDVPVGPGRGSGAGSLVAYVLKITDLDPIEHELLFERFLNPERVSMPDFDVDFCMEGRDRVIDYVARTYGRQSVSQIITYGSMAAKAVVRDVGRVLAHGYGFVDRIAKLIPFDIGMTLTKALEESPELKAIYDSEEEVKALLDMALKLEGISRNAGKHAGGVVISPTVLTDFAALYCEEDGSNLVTQFDKDDVEAVGLVKFDFLGLRTLTIVDWALKTINALKREAGEQEVDITVIPMADEASFSLLKSANTSAIFQLESQGMKELIKKLQPDSFEDITALVALFRPGPLQSGMVDDFIARKHGRQEVEYPHPDLEPILKPTYGVILYQEQVMQIAQVLANYTLGGADMLRRAMGKKKPEEMAKQGDIFRKGAVARGVDESVATYIFDLMEKFAGYGFNKSHSAAYALVSYQTIWLKTHYPAAFMAAVLSADMDSTEKVVSLVEDCKLQNVTVRPPHVNHSCYKFTIAGEEEVIYGLGAIKGVGEGAIESIVQERQENGEYEDIFDFCQRIDLRKANKRVMDSLIKSGALEGLAPNRATLTVYLPIALKLAEQSHAAKSVGQNDLFAALEPEVKTKPDAQMLPAQLPEWEDEQRLQGEKDTLGLYLTGHPIDRYLAELKQLGVTKIANLSLDKSHTSGQRRNGPKVMIAGLSLEAMQRKTQRGFMGGVTLDDKTERIEIVLFNEAFEEHKERLINDQILVVIGMLVYDDYRDRLSIRTEQILTVQQARERWAHHILLQIDPQTTEQIDQLFTDFSEKMKPVKNGACPIRLVYQNDLAKATLELGSEWRITPSDMAIRDMQSLFGRDKMEIFYHQLPGG